MAVVLVRARSTDNELEQSLLACASPVHVVTPTDARARIRDESPDTVVVQLGDDARAVLADLGKLIAERLPAPTRLIAVGDLRDIVLAPGIQPPDCVLFADPDDATLKAVLGSVPAIDPGILLDELLTLSVLGQDLPTMLQELTIRVARAFGADECVLFLSQEASYYTARETSEDAVTNLAPLCDIVCRIGTTLIAPARPDRPYRAFLGVPLAHDNQPPLALLLLCRERPIAFHLDAQRYLRRLASRLAIDLSWRLVQERLLSDRGTLRGSSIDPVLGVENRTALQDELSQRVAASERSGEPFSVAVIDVDGLRLINERSGYPAGDAVLAHIAQGARTHCRPQDIVARYSGDSVAIVMPGLNAVDATTSLTRILSAIDDEPVVHETKQINLIVSAGIAELRYDTDTGETALARAMAARKKARLHGDVIAVADVTDIAEEPAQLDFAIGTTLAGVYQIRHEISRGAFGVVYRAEDLALGRQIALKLLRPDLARDTKFVDRFRSEAATLARIRNPNLVQVYAFGIDGSNVFFAMELVEGHGLDERIASAHRRRRHLPLAEVTSVIDQVAHALEAVHQAGVLHRDVKPANVLIDRIHRRCVLVDVGIAVRRGEKSVGGTPGFTAPEVFGDGGESPATDVYSLAALAYVLLTLHSPFGDASWLELLSAQARARPTPLTSIRRDLPPAVDGVLLPALDPDPTQRPQTARALAKALSNALADTIGGPVRSRPRMTLAPVEVQDPTEIVEAPRVLFRNASLRSKPTIVASTRGILFRSAYEVLGARRGSAWITKSKMIPELASAITQSASLGWHPTLVFMAMLEALPDDARTLAIQLGKTTVATSLRQFYGAEPSAVTPAQVLRSAELFWGSYHSWGVLSVDAGMTDAKVTITNGLASGLLCASTAGLLSGVLAHADATEIVVEHPACIATGATSCLFRLAWRPEPEPERER